VWSLHTRWCIHLTLRQHMCAIAKLSALHELYGKVLYRENYTLKCHIASADELHEIVVVHIPFLHFYISAARNLMGILEPETWCW
jgi:hypothetical protein